MTIDLGALAFKLIAEHTLAGNFVTAYFCERFNLMYHQGGCGDPIEIVDFFKSTLFQDFPSWVAAQLDDVSGGRVKRNTFARTLVLDLFPHAEEKGQIPPGTNYDELAFQVTPLLIAQLAEFWASPSAVLLKLSEMMDIFYGSVDPAERKVSEHLH